MGVRVMVLVIGCFVMALTGSPVLAQKPAANPLDKLSWFAGKWSSHLKNPKGDPLIVETTFTWAGHKKALKFSVTFKVKDDTVSQYEGLYWWHPAQKEIRMLQIDRQGNMTEATLTINGNQLSQRNLLTKTDGSKQQQRVELVRENEDTFSFKALVPKGEDWVEAVAFKYHRIRPETAPAPK